jgi:hypothetical protein
MSQGGVDRELLSSGKPEVPSYIEEGVRHFGDTPSYGVSDLLRLFDAF